VLFSNLRIFLYLTYALLLIWRGVRHGVDGVSFALLVGFVALANMLLVAERLQVAWRIRATKQQFLSLDPSDQARVLAHTWLGGTRALYAEAVEEAGAPTKEGAVERFPFPLTVHRHNSLLFWTVATLAGSAVVAVFAVPSFPVFLQWSLWAWSFVAAILLAWLRRRGGVLRSVLEISPFGIALVAEDDTRQALRWTEQLRLRNRPLARRVDLFTANKAIPLHYGRLSFDRVIRLVLEYGDWTPDAA